MQAAPVRGQERTVSSLTAAWIAKGASTLDRPAAPPLTEPSPPAWSEPAPTDDAVGHRIDLDELLHRGQEAARAGDRLVAYQLFVRAIEVDPSNEHAWLWRAGTCDRPEEAIRCLEQVLVIDPDNERARRGLSTSQRHLAGL